MLNETFFVIFKHREVLQVLVHLKIKAMNEAAEAALQRPL